MPKVDYDRVPLKDLELPEPVFTQEAERNKLTSSIPQDLGDFQGNVKFAMDTANESLKQIGTIAKKINETRQKLVADPMLNQGSDLNARVNAYNFSEKRTQEVFTISARAQLEVTNTIHSIDNYIKNSKNPEHEAFERNYGEEVRKHVHSLDYQERQEFFNQSLQNEDYATIESAVNTSTPNYLTGLSPQEKESILKSYRQQRFGKLLKAQQVLNDSYAALEASQNDISRYTQRLKSREVVQALNAGKDSQAAMGDVQIKWFGKDPGIGNR